MAMFEREDLYNSMGRKKTKALFKETCQWDTTPILSLLPGSHRGVPSLRDLYVKYCLDDPTETIFAETVFGDLEFWYEIKGATWFQPYYEEYTKTTDLKRKSLAMQFLVQEVKTQGKSAMQAAKYLIEEPWKGKEGTRADRRKVRKEVQESAEEAYEASGAAEDVERLRDMGLIN